MFLPQLVKILIALLPQLTSRPRMTYTKISQWFELSRKKDLHKAALTIASLHPLSAYGNTPSFSSCLHHTIHKFSINSTGRTTSMVHYWNVQFTEAREILTQHVLKNMCNRTRSLPFFYYVICFGEKLFQTLHYRRSVNPACLCSWCAPFRKNAHRG